MAVRRRDKVRGPWGAVLKEEIRRRISSRRVAGVRPTGSERPRTLPALELGAALRSCKGVLAAVAVITATLNVLYLTSSFFMLEVYDRVVPSRSVPTLSPLPCWPWRCSDSTASWTSFAPA